MAGSGKVKQLGLLTPEQETGLKDYMQHGIEESPLYGAGSDFLQRLLSGDPEMMQQFMQPYMNQFNQQIIPGIAERFAGMGTGAGAGSSSAFNQTATQAGSNLMAQLAQLRGNMQMQGAGQGLQYAQQPFSNTLGGLGVHGFENLYIPQAPSAASGLLGGLGGGLAQGIGMAAGGPLGGAAAQGAYNWFQPKAPQPGKV